MRFFVIVAVSLVGTLTAQDTCNPNGSMGPCMNGQCGGGFTCINTGTGTEECCDNTMITPAPTVPPPTTAAPTVAPTAPPTGTTAATTVAGATTTRINCVDQVNPNTGVSDCTKMASYCTNAVYYDLMTQQCPATCGRCTGSVTSATCVDKINPSTGVSDCTKMTSYCTNSVYYTLMTEQCPRTCGRCTGGGTVTTAPITCVDKINPSTGVSDCTKMASYCNNSSYFTLMTEQCPRTCNRCSGTGTGTVTTATTTCVDKINPSTGVSDCPQRASYCNNSAYYTLMTEQCPRTCGRCSG